MLTNVMQRRRLLLFLGAASVASAIGAAPALAEWVKPRMETKNLGNKVRVKLWVSLQLGSTQLSNHYLGTYYVPTPGELKHRLQAEAAMIDMIITSKNEAVELVLQAFVGVHKAHIRLLQAAAPQ